MNSEKLLILGCGDLGRRLARTFTDSRYQITGVRRQPPVDRNESLQYVAGDLHDPEALAKVIAPGFDVIVVTMTPVEPTDAGYRKGYVDVCRNLIRSLQILKQSPRLLVFVSSTGVYGQNDGSWVDESSPTRPASFSGTRLLEAEQLVRNSGYAHCVVRFSGIYGPGRNRLMDQVRAGKVTLTNAFTNRIHADDCAAVLAHLIERHRNGQLLEPVYVASDCEPAPMANVVQWLAREMDVAITERSCASIQERANKRCSNKLLLRTGFGFLYPDYRSGYRALLGASE